MHIGLAADAKVIYAVALDATGNLQWQQQCPLPTHRQGLVQAIAAMLAEAESRLGCDCSVGLALPPRPQAVSDNPMSSWLGTPLFAHQLRQALSRPLSVAGHFPCLVLADVLRSGADSCFALDLGEQCSTLTTFGKLLAGFAYRSGKDWAHSPLPGYSLARDGMPQACQCGGLNCIERFVSVSGFEQRFWENFGVRQTAQEILLDAAAGEERAQYHYHHFHDALARALVWVCQTFAPARILLRGILADEHSLQKLSGMLTERVQTVAQLALLVDDPETVALGAAWLPEAQPEQQQRDPRPDFEVQLNQLPFRL